MWAVRWIWFRSAFRRGVVHFKVLIHVVVNVVFFFLLVTGGDGLVVKTRRRGLNHGGICCFEVGDTLFQIAEVLNASLIPKYQKSGQKTFSLENVRTDKMASLCISWSWQAGIMSFKTANSSFIFDLRLRSMTLCAVFRAIFFPAALVELGCFLPDVPFVTEAATAPFLLLVRLGAVACGANTCGCSFCCDAGSIWIILRERVGGGGSSKVDFAVAGRICCGLETVLAIQAEAMAGGGRAKVPAFAEGWAISLAWMSREEAGVGGSFTRGIVGYGRRYTVQNEYP